MRTDYLIIGQGICGTMLAWFLHKEGKRFIVIDDSNENAASRVAAGIINPVTGRRYVNSWMIDTIMPFAEETYTEIGSYLDTNIIQHKNGIDFFTSPQMRDAFTTRITEDDTYLHTYPDQNKFNQYFNYDFGCGGISPAYIINMQLLMASWRKKLMDKNAFVEEAFNLDDLDVEEDHISYHGIIADKIIFCDGIKAMNNPWFNLLPFSANKGEALIIESPELTNEHIFKKGLMLVPLPVQNTFWIGSNYQWTFTDEKPSEQFREQALNHLKSWLRHPFRLLFHKAGIRPATVERRPFVGLHPKNRNIGILNGMGTKGSSLAPFFASQLAQHLVHGSPIHDEANIARFHRILTK
jgi:glycine/D-amino acid oxidase-like deaminating enzyme